MSIPITFPWASISGPPELPGLIGASVWITLKIGNLFGAWISRWRAETIPEVTVFSKPNGLPIATTDSPTWTLLESPNDSGVIFTWPGSMRMTARSWLGSLPANLACTGA